MQEWIAVVTDNIVNLWIACVIGFTWNIILSVLVLYAIHRKPNNGAEVRRGAP